MHIEDIRRWQWMVIGLLVGLAIAHSRLSMGPDDGGRIRSIGVERFVDNLARRQPNGLPWIRNVFIYPPAEGKHYVTFDLLEALGQGKGAYRSSKMYADIPFKLVGQPAPRPDFTIIHYIEQARARDSRVTYRYAWWREPKWAYAIFGTAGFALIGITWPTALLLLAGAGLGKLPRSPEEKKAQAEYDLSRFGKGTGHGAPAKPAIPAVTAHDLQQVAQLTQKLEAGLKGTHITGSSGAGVASSTQPVRKLDGGPLETSLPEQPKEEHVYSGEYYPVDRGVKKKDAEEGH